MATRRAFTLLPHQRAAYQFIANTPRCALWAGMGMGKTSVTLTFLNDLHSIMGESAPTLILGPKRVAEGVWPDEAQKWEHLRGFDVLPIAGTPTERAAALRQDAPVYTIGYDNLKWLRDQSAGRAWPFRTVVADESTRLKSYRTKQGGKRAAALREFAHRDVARWINLTGTPSPKGLEDLWGQTWFLDAGQRLGTSFSAYEERYFSWKRAGDAFAKTRHQIQKVVAPYAQEQIHAKLADICLTLDPKDWFDPAEPVVNVIEVTLPARAMAQYREFEREMFVALDGGDVEAFNAAGKSIKCLQMANGAAYLGDSELFATMHDAKLDALESLVEESSEPVLCAYHFKSDLARLRDRFPDALVLGTKDGMAAAKAGQGRLWLGHPASMGHGVDGLQEHTATVAFFGHWWDMELHDQFIERVGPMRQLQAGKGRVCFIHYIVAKGTVDNVVLQRHRTKAGVQQLLMDYMKEKK